MNLFDRSAVSLLLTLWSLVLGIISVDAFALSRNPRLFVEPSSDSKCYKYYTVVNTDQEFSGIEIGGMLSRRDVFSKTLFCSLGFVSALSKPIDSFGVARAEDEISYSSTSFEFKTPSLLAEYKPNDFKTFPLKGRTIFPPAFLPPLQNRATYRYELGRDAWALEQLLAFANVTATIRTNVVKLRNGGLWVSGPLWPTEEYCALLDELGPVTDVVLPVNALEHKAAMKQFTAKYPDAMVWISPGQYGPFGSCGVITDDMDKNEAQKVLTNAAKTMGHRVDGIFPVGSLSAEQQNKSKLYSPPWIDEFNIETLYVELPENAGPVSECAFFHKPSMTLFVTDAVICVPSVSNDSSSSSANALPKFPIQPIFETYFDKTLISNPTFWPRTVLQAVFLPLRSDVSNDATGKVTYPGYEALTNRLVRAPILRAFADARSPIAVREWVDRIAGVGSADQNGTQKNNFDRIVTSHFASPIMAGPNQFAGAFAHLLPLNKIGAVTDDEEMLRSIEDMSSTLPPIKCEDWSTLDSLNEFIDKNKLGAPVVYDFKMGCKR
ncbi:hypothetical protein ACHAXS_003647 [Conticribra weissflogii]